MTSSTTHRRLACTLILLVVATGAPVAAAQEAETTDGTVDARLDAQADARIERRLEATFAALESLAGVTVEVRAGVVQLDGEVLTSADRDLAGALAQRVEGVAAVQNRVRESRSARLRLEAVRHDLEQTMWDALARLPLVALAALVLASAALLARWAARWRRPFAWAVRNPLLRDIARQAVRAVILFVGLLLALEVLDATPLLGAVLGAAGITGLAIGFALRDIVENYVASVLLSLRRPFAPNDHVRIETWEGKVVRLTPRATILLSLEGNHVRVPNAVVFKGTIVNFTRKPERRFDFSVGIGNGEDLAEAQEVACSALRRVIGLLPEPPPLALVDALAESSVTLRVYGWIDQRRADFERSRSEAIRLVKAALDARGIEMPVPIRRLHVEPVAQPDAASVPAAPETAPQETAPDSHLDQEIRSERAEEEPDLLAADAPSE